MVSVNKHSEWLRFGTMCLSVLIAGWFAACSAGHKSDRYVSEIPPSPWLNHHDSVVYTGKEACRDCHFQNYTSYLRTGMGRSFGRAKPEKSDAVFHPDSVIYDSFTNLFYHPFWADTVMMVREFRLDGRDTVYQRTERVDYVIGSGHHTNSHIFLVNGYAFQIPFTWYTQQQLFDLPPGFENGHNQRFSRYLGLECISCHNGLPALVAGSQNKYDHMPLGIDCERCHGPGSLHVKRTKAGILVDTSKTADLSIVNPRRLSKQLQNDLCARCHLQGTMVLREGRSFYDFRPGMALTDIMDVFMPAYEGGPPTLIMASHIERMMESACYLRTDGDLSCIQCHNPHISVAETPAETFNAVCVGCHKDSAEEDHRSELARSKPLENCVTCHMIKRDSRDIPHVKITDHRISLPDADLSLPLRFKGLVAVNNRQTDAFTKAKGYLREYETYYANPVYLDSARYYLSPHTGETSRAHFKAFVQYFFLTENHGAIRHLVRSNGLGEVLGRFLTVQDFDNEDAWAAYRIGQAFESDKDLDNAALFYRKATSLAPYHAEMMNKLGSLLVKTDSIAEARRIFSGVVNEHPRNDRAWVNLGYCEGKLNKPVQAFKSFEMALRLNPDNVQALINLAGLYVGRREFDLANELALRAAKLEPDNPQLKELMKVFNR